MRLIVSSIINILEERKGIILPFNEHMNLHFDIEKDVHTSSKNYAKSDYGMDLLTASSNRMFHILGKS
jgi:hypothetical protein